MSRPRNTRTPNPPPAHRQPEMPVVLPHVVMTIAGDGAMTVTVDGQPYPPEPFAPPWQRESFPHLIDQLTRLRQCPIRVEVREADGTVFTDIIAPGRRRSPDPQPIATRAPVVPTAPPKFMGLCSEGFVPGEDIAVAVVVARTDAAPTGTVRAILTAEQVALSPTGEVVLLGRVSGTVAVGKPA